MPKLRIIYSWVYDGVLHEYHKKKYLKKEYKEGLVRAKRLQKRWDKIEAKVFRAMSKVSGLKWKDKVIDCFIVKYVSMPFSQPMTIWMWQKGEYLLETIVHELVHQLFIQNQGRVKYSDSRIAKKYKKESLNVRIHTPTHAVLKLTLEKVFGKEKTKHFIKAYNHLPEYKKAWQIVEKEGAENIIKDAIRV